MAKGMGDLISSTQKFKFEENKTGLQYSLFHTKDIGGETVGIIPTLSDANAIHEAVHAVQYLNGILSQSPGVTGDIFNGESLQTEIIAYQIQYAYEHGFPSTDRGKVSNILDINANAVKGIISISADGRSSQQPYSGHQDANAYYMRNLIHKLEQGAMQPPPIQWTLPRP